MQTHWLNHRFSLLACGLVMGLAVSSYWPHEPLKANATSLEKFSLCTAPTLPNQSDAVFVLDSVTGRLVGAAHSMQTGGFENVWTRSVATDFGVTEKGQYLMTSGFLRTQGAANGTPANSGVYVAELTSGRVGLYGFLMNNLNQASSTPLIPIADFSFRNGK